ncbi:hypothetical protein CORC01_01892 [Colletotrichum orchidophilum]|uniref:Uncharacterized protein n=1 Tax=Colletotrichum orchidophilum TaxID=1209926 RepID=A0A1G4BMX3_9PEZI|nr:uncharacterized protein CORC01_01892 [Colletotrichum orchidophilum]OHF02791.1 hypothetical protein CORC01_01892 [Colletotrichum orchidophilum]
MISIDFGAAVAPQNANSCDLERSKGGRAHALLGPWVGPPALARGQPRRPRFCSIGRRLKLRSNIA